MKKLAIIGSGDLGQLIAHHAVNDKHYSVSGFFDDFKTVGEYVSNVPILGKLKDAVELFEQGVFDELMIGVGYKHISFRKSLFEEFASKIPMGKIIHSSAYVDSSCMIGSGVFVLPGCVLDYRAELKNNVLLNTGCIIAHDSVVGEHTFLSPGVTLAGFVKIDECCNIGINTTVIDNIYITSNVRTGGGSVIIKSIEAPGLYVGNPARFVR